MTAKKYENVPRLTDVQLRAIAEMEPPADYPKERLKIEPETWAKMERENRIIIPRMPDAPWRVDTHPNRTNAPEHSRHLIEPSIHERPISQEQIDKWHAMGLQTDHETGEAIHYHAAQIITTVGMYGGLGFLFQQGPQGVTATIVRRNPHGSAPDAEGEYAIIQREDNNMWVLPVGFGEPGEPPEVTGPRECEEETGLERAAMGGVAVAMHVEYSVGRGWDTLNAWSELTVVRIQHPNQEYLRDTALRAGDDAIDARWFTVSEAAPLAEAGQFSKTSLRFMQLTEASIHLQG